MLRFLTGNLLDAPTEALGNSVNTVGAMGNGLALLFKEAFPGNFAAYAAAVKRVEVQVAPHVRHGAGCSGRPPVSDQLPHQAASA